ncbi:phosphoprotein [Caligus rogercresseyi rhabdovirus]|uniref:Phosphoprotein n=1 Tax=Caligus rogercresseyi rhabdovirus TaxID=1921414 RepID=A0A1L2YZV3_9RHAB|nr:phosphoprotein [Caligus rogercresseyi rhabdovirus]APF32074.1 phosphoprotein [Caligus rogercresseyi rhabdovirus]
MTSKTTRLTEEVMERIANGATAMRKSQAQDSIYGLADDLISPSTLTSESRYQSLRDHYQPTPGQTVDYVKELDIGDVATVAVEPETSDRDIESEEPFEHACLIKHDQLATNLNTLMRKIKETTNLQNFTIEHEKGLVCIKWTTDRPPDRPGPTTNCKTSPQVSVPETCKTKSNNAREDLLYDEVSKGLWTIETIRTQMRGKLVLPQRPGNQGLPEISPGMEDTEYVISLMRWFNVYPKYARKFRIPSLKKNNN